MTKNGDSDQSRERDERRSHTKLFDLVMSSVHERRSIRKEHAVRTETVDGVLADHARALRALPDD